MVLERACGTPDQSAACWVQQTGKILFVLAAGCWLRSGVARIICRISDHIFLDGGEGCV